MQNIEEIKNFLMQNLSDRVSLKTGAIISKQQYLEEFVSEEMIQRYGNLENLITNTIQNLVEKEEEKKVSTIVEKEDNVIKVTSDYLGININRYQSKTIDFYGLLITLALDDGMHTKDFIGDFTDYLQKCSSKEEMEEMLLFLQDISKVGELGKEYQELLSTFTIHYKDHFMDAKGETKEETIDMEPSFENEYDTIKNQIELFKMELDEVKAKNPIDTDDLRFIVGKMEKEKRNLDLIYQKNHDTSIRTMIDDIEQEIISNRKLATNIEEMARVNQY